MTRLDVSENSRIQSCRLNRIEYTEMLRLFFVPTGKMRKEKRSLNWFYFSFNRVHAPLQTFVQDKIEETSRRKFGARRMHRQGKWFVRKFLRFDDGFLLHFAVVDHLFVLSSSFDLSKTHRLSDGQTNGKKNENVLVKSKRKRHRIFSAFSDRPFSTIDFDQTKTSSTNVARFNFGLCTLLVANSFSRIFKLYWNRREIFFSVSRPILDSDSNDCPRSFLLKFMSQSDSLRFAQRSILFGSPLIENFASDRTFIC